jgi:hypothetical protein
MSARAKVLFLVFSTALVTAVNAMDLRPPAQEDGDAMALAAASAPVRGCDTPWASCFGRATTR